VGLGRIDRGRLAAWSALVTVWIALDWYGRLTTSTPKDSAYSWSIAVGSVFQFAIVLGLIALIARGAWSRLALRRPRSVRSAFSGAFLVLVVVNLLEAALSPLLHPGREQGLAPSRWEPAHAGAFAVFAFAGVGCAPVAEELLFRGLGFSLLRPFGRSAAIVGPAVLWSLAHALVEGLPIFIVFGIGLAWLRERQNSTIPGMILHGTFNAAALILSLAT